MDGIYTSQRVVSTLRTMLYTRSTVLPFFGRGLRHVDSVAINVGAETTC